MRLTIAEEATPELVAAFQRLVPQLSKSNPPPTEAQVKEIVGSPATDVFVARDGDGAIVGVSTLVTFRIPTAVRSWVEDVVVDDAARGRGIGETIINAMVARARQRGAATVDLTSRPSRESANRLYQRAGFVLRETNVYRYDLRTSP